MNPYQKRKREQFVIWNQDVCKGKTLACGKKCAPSKSKAKEMMRKLTLRPDYSDPGVPLEVYYCKKCNAWHVGHDRLKSKVDKQM